MMAIVTGLNSSPIHRLKRSWEQVSSRHMSQLETCEALINSYKHYNSYRSTLANVAPPCVPFIGMLCKRFDMSKRHLSFRRIPDCAYAHTRRKQEPSPGRPRQLPQTPEIVGSRPGSPAVANPTTQLPPAPLRSRLRQRIAESIR